MHTQTFSTLRITLLAAALTLTGSAFAQATGAPAMPAENPDASFVQEAGAGGLAEVDLSELALIQASSPAVKSFAQQMVDDHTANNKELALVASKQNLRVPTDIDAAHVKIKADLAAKHGADFDRAYIAAMQADHKKMAALLEQTQGSTPNQDVRTFAQKTLPVVRHHLQMANSLAAG